MSATQRVKGRVDIKCYILNPECEKYFFIEHFAQKRSETCAATVRHSTARQTSRQYLSH